MLFTSVSSTSLLQATGKFDAEIVPVATKVTTDEGEPVDKAVAWCLQPPLVMLRPWPPPVSTCQHFELQV